MMADEQNNEDFPGGVNESGPPASKKFRVRAHSCPEVIYPFFWDPGFDSSSTDDRDTDSVCSTPPAVGNRSAPPELTNEQDPVEEEDNDQSSVDDDWSDNENSSPSIDPSPISYPSHEENDLDPEWTQFLLDQVTLQLQHFVRSRYLAILEGFSREDSDDETPPKMSIERPKLLFVDGTFAELGQAMADIVQVGDQVKPLLEKEQNEEALQTIVKASSHLNTVPEKEFNPSYNLLIHLVLESKDPKKYLPIMCSNLLKPIPSSPVNHMNLASNALTTIFNNLAPDNPLRYNVFMQICRFLKQNNHYEGLRPMLKNLPKWLKEWDTDEEDARKLYVEVAEIASEGGDGEESYHSLLQALNTFDREDQEEITSQEAQQLSLRALRMALLSDKTFLFQDLRALPTVQALSDSHPIYAQLLDIFTEQELEDYSDFKEEHEDFIEKEKLDDAKLERKMRLLTFASLAASTSNREIPYANIARALQIPVEQVEMWSIDVIRAKLVEGRLSQKDKVFKVHRTTYRVFAEKQWRELGTRVDQYKTVVDNLLVVIRRQQAEAQAAAEREQADLERKLANAGIDGEGGASSGNRGMGGERSNRGGGRGGRGGSGFGGGRGGFGGRTGGGFESKEPREPAAPRAERDDNDD